MKFDQIIGQNIRDLRNSVGISQTKLGEMLTTKVTFQQIQKYEKGVNRISAQTLLEFSKALQVPLIVFYKGIKDYKAELQAMGEYIDRYTDNKGVAAAVTNLSELIRNTKFKSN